MNFRQVANQIARRGRVSHAQAAIRGAHGTGAARWLAAAAGVSPRTARRWLSGAFPRGRAANIMEAAGDAVGSHGIAATVLASGISDIDVGSVDVEYDGTSQGSRAIGSITITDGNSAYLAQAAADLAIADLDAAAEAFSAAVIYGYQPGLENTLQIGNYNDGVELS